MELPLSEIASVIGSLAVGGHGLAKSFKFIREGEEGVKLRFGKAVRDAQGEAKVYKPGFTVIIPYVDTLVRRHTRVQTLELPQQTVTIKNNLSYIVDTVIRFKVVKIYNALFVVDNLDMVMTNVSMAELRDVVTSKEKAEDMTDIHGMNDELTEKLKKHAADWGVEIEQFSIVSCVPTPESQQIVNMAAGVAARVKALMDGFKDLGLENKDIGRLPQLAASLIGIPVSTSIGMSPGSMGQFAAAVFSGKRPPDEE